MDNGLNIFISLSLVPINEQRADYICTAPDDGQRARFTTYLSHWLPEMDKESAQLGTISVRLVTVATLQSDRMATLQR
ncbi:hypothetical protein SLA2020_198340 [Shorea laevis]